MTLYLESWPASGPLVRSSYRAGRLWATAMRKKGRDIPAHLAHIADGIEDSGHTRQEAASHRARESNS